MGKIEILSGTLDVADSEWEIWQTEDVRTKWDTADSRKAPEDPNSAANGVSSRHSANQESPSDNIVEREASD